MSQIEWVVFDLGNVLIRVDRDPIYQTLSKEIGRPINEITAHFSKMPNVWEEIAVREIDAAELASVVNLPISPEAVTRALNAELLDTIEESVAILKDLKGRYKIACLSNTNSIHWVELMKLPFMQLFDYHIASQHLKLAKPDPAIYKCACELLQTTPEKCLFFDDRVDNIEAAQKLGWNAYVFHNPSQLPGQLEAHGIKLLKAGVSLC